MNTWTVCKCNITYTIGLFHRRLLIVEENIISMDVEISKMRAEIN